MENSFNDALSNNAASSAPANGATNAQNAKLDAIRDILFGQNIKQYDETFKQLENLITEGHDQIRQQIDQAATQLLQNLQQAESGLRGRIDAVEQTTLQELDRQDQTHVNKQQLVAMLNAFGTEFGK
ncbi:hypothetical protein SAMN05421780_102144 [Flexibacter flexilis DSM 6793]|uniref:Uncharacterized protein n=1 Tax=Flexibacter flexilis DSM 6793 TaxID=927664 RepID=A0A1I1FDA5_9BACT|nr:hypothetical protein [Flexibacter flexilis]SFB97377.1 hypothetical protein SAMN05421780_102144 [Flexibacter flexilis DSM 6793]